VGSNGAGKSTFLRVVSGIYQAESGMALVDGENVYENTAVKKRCFYISDEQYFFSNSTPKDIRDYYAYFYPDFDKQRFDHLIKNFDLPLERKINTFSKGMKKQISVIAALASQTDYIFCDETFDGLDPVIRQGVKSLFAADIDKRRLTPIIASHNLRELEDICDHVGLLHKGGILFSRDLDDMKMNIHKIQAVFTANISAENFPAVKVLSIKQRGSFYTITACGEEKQIIAAVREANPVFMEVLPLTLEEIFISETEAEGYDIKKLLA
jgi:ABC-2 type transport system ATP-binding protein